MSTEQQEVGPEVVASNKETLVESGGLSAPTPPRSTVKSKAAKTTAKKEPARRSRTSKQTSASKKTADRPAAAKYPRHTLEKALRIPRALIDQNAGRPATREEAIKLAGGTGVSGAWSLEISSGQKYGLLESDSGTISVTDRARRIISPQSEVDRQGALRDSILQAPDFSEVYNYFRGEALPDEPYFSNALRDRFEVPPDKVSEFQQLLIDSLQYAGLLDKSGPQVRVLDVGRKEGGSSNLRAERGRSKSSNDSTSGESCFVMQPFAGALGSYYESIFKPAIEQAGMIPVRADADIFATGKIVDQIWRGINSAKVLVAELTSKNPNVFYELGLAHALRKPVVLVSSNEEDVPFDLRHIRVIVYDQTDPFWGTKLIDKVADNIRSAVDNPEDAIFRIEGEL